jgi:hypothetical protein
VTGIGQPTSVVFTMKPVEVSVLRQTFGVRSRMFPLRLDRLTADPVRRAVLTAAVDDALEKRGLAAAGEVVPGVRSAFELLAEHRVAVSITGSGVDLTMLAVSDDVRAVLVTQRPDDELRFSLFPAGELVSEVVAVVPPAQAASDGPFGPQLGGGLLAASGRGRRGLWVDMLGWVDTANGRHVVRTAADRSGNLAARYEPAGRAELSAAITELLGNGR